MVSENRLGKLAGLEEGLGALEIGTLSRTDPNQLLDQRIGTRRIVP